MFNDHLSIEAARERIQRRIEEVEAYSLQKQLGYSERGNAKLMFLLIILLTALAAALLL
jgi:hypothetical protein